MDLRSYLRSVGISQKAFAESIGIPLPSLANIMNRRGDIYLSTALKIVEATEYKVMLHELIRKSLLTIRRKRNSYPRRRLKPLNHHPKKNKKDQKNN